MKQKLFILLLSVLPLTTFAQQKKVAVYVTGEDAEVNKVLGSKLSSAIGRDNNYSVIERADGFLAAIAKEQSYQRTGAVDDEEISRIGKQFGAQLVCVTTIDKAFDIPYISSRLVDVETAEIEGAANFSSALNSGKDVMTVGDTLTQRLLRSIASEKALAWKKVAVYIVPTKASKSISHILGNQIVTGFTNTGRYVAIERTNSFLSQLGAEQNYQRTGAVNDQEISQMGKQLGAHYVCVVDITEVLGEKYISARMTDVETAEIINMYEESVNLHNVEDCIETAKKITQKLSKGTYEEQFYEDADYVGHYNYIDALNYLASVDVPDWFMNLAEDVYLGISMPGGDAMDAIGMALIQKIIASDLYLWYDSKNETEIVEDKVKKAFLSYSEDSVHISIDTEISYNIQELVKLPSGEYICRITDGYRNRLRITITYDKQKQTRKMEVKKESENQMLHDIKLSLEYAKRKYEMNIYEVAKTLKDKTSDTKTLYECFYTKDFDKHEYEFMNRVTDNNEQTENNKMLYIYPTPHMSNDSILTSYYYLYSPKKCLAEQLLVYYMDIIHKSLPDNHDGYIYRKKTPIVKQIYDNSTFIIQCKK